MMGRILGRAAEPPFFSVKRSTRGAQWVRSGLMLVMQEDGKVRSYGVALNRHRLLK
jgi:hypothetical protein